ncbi:hypothetical protein [Streptomyces sp. TR06-5]|uniref:hypothetical protein n=1 Tax=Streptomyces sp. TR06-5 TaxID=3385976 RepID=UPI0039A09304
MEGERELHAGRPILDWHRAGVRPGGRCGAEGTVERAARRDPEADDSRRYDNQRAPSGEETRWWCGWSLVLQPQLWGSVAAAAVVAESSSVLVSAAPA